MPVPRPRSRRAKIVQLQREVQQLTTEQQADESRLSSLRSQVPAVSRPTDPLSAYNQICNQTFTNSQTGVDQLIYFPCTNNVTTIPQPGS